MKCNFATCSRRPASYRPHQLPRHLWSTCHRCRCRRRGNGINHVRYAILGSIRRWPSSTARDTIVRRARLRHMRLSSSRFISLPVQSVGVQSLVLVSYSLLKENHQTYHALAPEAIRWRRQRIRHILSPGRFLVLCQHHPNRSSWHRIPRLEHLGRAHRLTPTGRRGWLVATHHRKAQPDNVVAEIQCRDDDDD